METETVTLEPENKYCPRCGLEQHRIGEDVSEEFECIPAKLIRRRAVRPKYACRCGESTVVIAPMPPRLLPQSKLGLGLAVHLLLTRFDDHLSFYRLEHIFRERHGVEIPRQQMVQWIEHIAGWLKPIYEAMWQEMKAGNYLQIDETPVKVLDRDVSGKTESEEHTSELQSRLHLVCRLLLEKKKYEQPIWPGSWSKMTRKQHVLSLSSATYGSTSSTTSTKTR